MKRLSAFLFIIAASMLFLTAWAAQEDDLIIEDGFEGSLGNWTPTNGAALYTWPGGTNFNYASVGSGAARIPRRSGVAAILTLTEPLPLDQNEYTNVTFQFDWYTGNVGSTVRWEVEYSSDGGTNWISLDTLNATSTNRHTYSKTLDEGPYTFTDYSLFRIRGWVQTPTFQLYADEMKIIGFPKPPPQGTVITLY